ncbi:allophanate hydrolase subunit 1-domain-containing protein [Boletus reticuloceps]|uniref:Allophanate hydrolase subunit 1-domain-containing protein n=1 Tax=Boletus reticuloceps TaxID=495285 RepID=A0A8I2YWE7_9AGAM|nr:allophanate hydrolase subunit 1-domain-containing protein [Boletus reticuloceps]
MKLDFDLRAHVHALETEARKRDFNRIWSFAPCIRSTMCHFDPVIISQKDVLEFLAEVENLLPDTLVDIEFPGRKIVFSIALDNRWNREALERYMSTIRSKAVYLPSNIDYLAQNNSLEGSATEASEKLMGSSGLVFGVGFYLACPFLVPINPRCRLVGQKMNPSWTYTPTSGTVGIAGPVAAIYPVVSPGGYQLFGRTLPAWQTWGKGADFNPERPWLLRPFDQVLFMPITEDRYIEIEQEFNTGQYKFHIEPTVFSMATYTGFVKAIANQVAEFTDKQAEAAARMGARENMLLHEWLAQKELEASRLNMESTEVDELLDCTCISSSMSASVWKIKLSSTLPTHMGSRIILPNIKDVRFRFASRVVIQSYSIPSCLYPPLGRQIWSAIGQRTSLLHIALSIIADSMSCPSRLLGCQLSLGHSQRNPSQTDSSFRYPCPGSCLFFYYEIYRVSAACIHFSRILLTYRHANCSAVTNPMGGQRGLGKVFFTSHFPPFYSPSSSKAATSTSASPQMARPTRTNAGKGGYLSQLRKTSEALEQPQCELRVKDLLVHEPINLLAPAPSRPKKKGTAKQRIKVKEVNSDPFDNFSPIAPSGPDGRFGLQPQPTFVGRQTLDKYERDRTTNDMTAHTRKHGVHPQEIPRNNSDKGTQMNVDEHRSHERRREVSDFNGQEFEVPHRNHSHPRGECCEDRMDTTGDPQGAPVQPPHHCPQHTPLEQSRPPQNVVRDTVQPRRHVLNAQHLRNHALPSPPLSRSNLNSDNAQVNAVYHGDEQANADYDVLGRHHLTNCHHRSPNPRYLDNVRDGHHQHDGASRQQQTQYEVPVAHQEHANVQDDSRPDDANVRDSNHPNDGPLRQRLQEPVVGHDHTGAGNSSNAAVTDHQHSAIQAKPSQISYYPALWQQLLEIAKAEMRCALFYGHPFLPERQLALKGECYEVLLGVIARYEQEEKPVESGYGDYKQNMAEVDLQGKRLNFGHPVLKQVCLSVYYPKTSKSLRNFPDFQDAVPRKVLALVAAMVHFVLTLYKKHGKDINLNIVAKDLEGAYNKFMGSMYKLVEHYSKGRRFEDMIAQWAAEGMDGFSTTRGDDNNNGDEFGMNISDLEMELASIKQRSESDGEDQDFRAHAHDRHEFHGFAAQDDDDHNSGRSDKEDNGGCSNVDDEGCSDDDDEVLDDEGFDGHQSDGSEYSIDE